MRITGRTSNIDTKNATANRICQINALCTVIVNPSAPRCAQALPYTSATAHKVSRTQNVLSTRVPAHGRPPQKNALHSSARLDHGSRTHLAIYKRSRTQAPPYISAGANKCPALPSFPKLRKEKAQTHYRQLQKTQSVKLKKRSTRIATATNCGSSKVLMPRSKKLMTRSGSAAQPQSAQSINAEDRIPRIDSKMLTQADKVPTARVCFRKCQANSSTIAHRKLMSSGGRDRRSLPIGSVCEVMTASKQSVDGAQGFRKISKSTADHSPRSLCKRRARRTSPPLGNLLEASAVDQ